MADKRISQLVDRGTVANSDVVPIVVSGASTTNKATISSIQTFMQGNLDLGVTSVGLSMPSAFTVTGSPVTSSGNISVVGRGTVSQYIRGDGSLADFPQGGGGGGASVSYYLNLSVSQGSIGGIAYSQMSRVPVFGAGTDVGIASNGYIASFITDAGNPALLEIPAGNWNFETYLSASSSGGSPTFYIELYKVNSGGTATLIASNSGTPESISLGTNINPYFSALAVPTTSLTLTDRLAIRIFVVNSGRTITLHTENSHLCQIITTFPTGLTALNGLTAQVQNFATGTSGTDFAISSATNIHTFNLPDASATARGVVTTGTQTFAGYKIFNGTIGVNNDLQLVTVGTALNTFIKNINATGLTSIGSNGFGFNNANNIYFSGSSKGGGVFAFSNTGTQTYTLQDASGTLAFTSQIPSVAGVYLPLAGGTLTGHLNGTSATFSSSVTAAGLSINSAAATNSQINLSVNSSTYGFFGIAGSTNSAITGTVLGSMFLRTESQDLLISTNGGSIVALKLTAGSGAATFSGALNGTSGSFSGNFEIGNTSGSAINSSSGLGNLVVGNGGASPQGITIYTNSSTYGGLNFADATTGGGAYAGYIKFDHANDSMGFFIGNSPKLTIDSTGAATFSSSVTATSGVIESGGLNIKGTGGIAKPDYLKLTNASAGAFFWDIWRDNTNGNLNFGSAVGGAVSNYVSMQASGGISFNGDTAQANALDDYEEGAFTPVVEGSTSAGTASYTAQNGQYTKIGRAVSFNIYIDWNSGTGTGDLRVGNLPFTASASGIYPSVTIGEISGITLSANCIATCRVQISSNRIHFNQAVVGGGAVSSLLYDSQGYFTLSGTYYV